MAALQLPPQAKQSVKVHRWQVLWVQSHWQKQGTSSCGAAERPPEDLDGLASGVPTNSTHKRNTWERSDILSISSLSFLGMI
jgi:hypothetical protein